MSNTIKILGNQSQIYFAIAMDTIRQIGIQHESVISKVTAMFIIYISYRLKPVSWVKQLIN